MEVPKKARLWRVRYSGEIYSDSVVNASSITEAIQKAGVEGGDEGDDPDAEIVFVKLIKEED